MKKLFTLLLLVGCYGANAQTYLALQDFATASGTTPPAGWTNISYNGNPAQGWQFVTTTPTYLYQDVYGDNVSYPYAAISNATYGEHPSAKLATPAFSTTGSAYATLEFSEVFRYQIGNAYTIDYSLDSGANWTVMVNKLQDVVEGWQGGSGAKHTVVPLPATLQNKPSVQLRFSFTTDNAAFYWIIDNIKVTNRPPATRTAINGVGNWSSATTWAGGIVPAFFDDVVIGNNTLITIDVSPTIKNLTIGGGSSGYLVFDSSYYNELTVLGNLTTNNGSTFNAFYTNTAGRRVTVNGNLLLNGSCDFSAPGAELTLSGTSPQSISGTGNLGVASPIRTLKMMGPGTVTISRPLTITASATMNCTVNNGTNLVFDNTAGPASDSVELVKMDDNNLTSRVLVGTAAKYCLQYTYFSYAPFVPTVAGNEIPASNTLYRLRMGNLAGLTINNSLTLTSAFALDLYGKINLTSGSSITCTNSAYNGSPGYNDSYVQGGDFILTCAGTATKTFPVGVDGRPGTIVYNNLQANGTMAVRLLNSTAGYPGGNFTGLGTRRWYSRMVTGSVTGYSSVDIRYYDYDNLGSTPTSNIRVAFATGIGLTYFNVGQSYVTGYEITSSVPQMALGYHALSLVNSNFPLTWTGNAGTASWGDAQNWSTGNVPANTDEVILDGPVTVGLTGGSGNFAAKTLTVRSGVTFNSASISSLTIGPPAGETGFFDLEGNFNMVIGNININGYMACYRRSNTNATWQMSGGGITIDGNNGGDSATSVPIGTPMLQIGNGSDNQTTINGTGGSITIVDPPAARSGSTPAIAVYPPYYDNNNYHLDGITFRFGNGISTDSGQAQGFVFYTRTGYKNVPLGNVVIDTRTNINAGRFVNTSFFSYYHGDIKGNLTVNANAELRTSNENSSAYDSTAAPIVVGGDIINNGTIRILTNNNGRLILGSGDTTAINTAQTISGTGVWTSSATAINNKIANLTVNNKGSVTLNMPLAVTQNLYLQKGIVNTTTTNLLTHGDIVNHLPGKLLVDSGYISGPIKRVIPAGVFTDSTGLLPVGGGGFYRPAKISFTTAPTAAGSLTARFMATQPGTNGLPLNDAGTIINTVAQFGYWEILAGDDLTGGTYTAELTGNGFSGISNPAALRVVKRTNSASPWVLNGTHAAGSGVTARRTGLTGFSEFTMASNSANNPLPVSLLYIRGERQGSANTVYWATATEINNSGFELQRSADGMNFTKVAFITSNAINGNSSSILNYQYTDNRSLTGTTWYRIKQIDKDAKTSFSNSIAVKGLPAGFAITGVFPNPAVNTLFLGMSAMGNEKATIEVMDMNGKTIMQQRAQLVSGDNTIQLNVSTLAKGNYMLKLMSENGIAYTKAFVKN